MGIQIAKAARQNVMEFAIRAARDPKVTPDATWVSRVRWLSQEVAGGDSDAKGKTYVAALGAALLAKATDPRVDPLTQLASAGPSGYTLRGVAEDMQKQVLGVVHLGTLSKNPMNNKPFNGGGPRIDRFVIAGYLRHVYDTYVDWLRELDGYDADRALAALVAFTSVRMRVQQEENLRAASSARVTGARSVAELLDVVQQWMVDDPEEGARCQAVTGAVLDLLWDDVRVFPKHHPSPFDVIRSGSPPKLVSECKQKAIGYADVAELVRRAGDKRAPLALYIAAAIDQPPLPVERLRADAVEHHGVVLDVVYTVPELVAKVCVHAGVEPATVAAELPKKLATRCPDADVSAHGLQALLALLLGVSTAPA